MESKRKNGNLEQENLLVLLDQLVKEQEKMSRSLLHITETLTEFASRSTEIESNFKNINITTLVSDLKETRELIKKATVRIETERATERKFQVLLFPPQDAKLFYKIVFGRWFLYTIVALIIVKSYQLGIHQSDNAMRVEIGRINNNKIVKAWGQLYHMKNKSLHQLMDSALINTEYGERSLK